MRIPVVLKNKTFCLVWALGFLLLIIAFFVAYLNLFSLEIPLVIHFDAYRGIDFLGNLNSIFYTLIFALLINILNIIIAEALFNRERVLSYLILFATLFLDFTVLVAISSIVAFNI